MDTTVELTFGYGGTDFTRTYEFKADSSVTGSAVVSAVQAINASLAAGNDNGLSSFFVADSFDGTDGFLNSITQAKTKVTTVTVIDLDTEGDATNG